jgi:hypothetical protein
MERALGGGVAMPSAEELVERHSMERMIDRYQEMLLGLIRIPFKPGAPQYQRRWSE